jgi:LysR family transcriptional regulator, nitrogen assimilation regulatory protein
MDLRSLRYFAAIVEHGSLTRAAEALRIAQPALSQHLKRLEEEFGCRLLARTPRGVVATESGRRLAQGAAQLLDAADHLRDAVRGMAATPAGPAVIGVPTTFGPTVTAPLALEVRRLYPAVRLRVVEGLSGHMLEWLRNGAVDAALLFGVDEAPGLVREELAKERLRLVGRRDDPFFSGRDSVRLAEIPALPLVLPGRPHGVREEAERAALIARRPLNVAMEIDALEQIKTLVAEGVGYTILSGRVAAHGPDAARLTGLPIIEPEIIRAIHLAWAADRPLSHAARAVVDLLRRMPLNVTD